MTICIAAGCVAEDGSARVVVCTDMQVTYGGEKSDSLFKNKFLLDNWLLSFAGDIEEEHQASVHIRRVMREQRTEINESDIKALVMLALERRKREIREDLAIVRLGTSYKGLRRMARDGIAAAHVVLQEIADWEEERKVGYILSSIYGDMPHILEVLPGTPPSFQEQYAVVGASIDEAKDVLVRRGQSAAKSLGQTILALYEAKKAVEAVERSVGPSTMIAVQQAGALQPLCLKPEFIEGELENVRLFYQAKAGSFARVPSPPPEAYMEADF